jgi:bifunctional DNase/RNase
MLSLFHAFGISLDEVLIYKFSEGVFMSRLKLSNNEHNLELDSRTSDAVSLALRTNAPIYTTQEVLDKTGFTLKDDEKAKRAKRSINDLSVEELKKRLNRAVELEKYELAASIQKAINEKLGNEPKTEDIEE